MTLSTVSSPCIVVPLVVFLHNVQLCDCVLAGRQAGAVVEEGAAVARPFACLVNIATTAAR